MKSLPSYDILDMLESSTEALERAVIILTWCEERNLIKRSSASLPEASLTDQWKDGIFNEHY